MVTIDFGNGKVNEFRLWKGKERRLLERLKNTNDLSEENLTKILIDDCSLTGFKFYTTQESNFIIYKIYSEAFNKNIEVEWQCDCGHSNKEQIDINYLLSKSAVCNLDKFIQDEYIVIFKTPDYSNTESSFKALELYTDKAFLNLLLSIKEIRKGEVVLSDIQEIEDELESVDINIFDNVLEYYDSNSFKFTPIIECTCQKCGIKDNIFIDYIPGLV